MSDSTDAAEQAALVQRWLNALHQLDSTLPRPIAEAMARNVARTEVGAALSRLDAGLIDLEAVALGDLAGSEARTIMAVLLQMSQRVEQLLAKLRQLWDPSQ